MSIPFFRRTDIAFKVQSDVLGDTSPELLNQTSVQDEMVESHLEQPRATTQGLFTSCILGRHTYNPSAGLDPHSNNTRSLGSSDLDLYGMSCDPLPPLPPLPEFPVPQIDDKDLKDYVLPLYSRKWAVLYGYKRCIVDKDTWYKSAIISKMFEFPTFETTMDFVTEVARLAQTEDVSSGHMYGCVTLSRHTHGYLW